ncbi:MAG: PQQ-dependent sugar dehydrogenase [Candidatus Methylomirabilis oxyfera]|nr:PQQ-dependent sugar dehydrogenase [Candidatus Methylomirabilis oxyfera]
MADRQAHPRIALDVEQVPQDLSPDGVAIELVPVLEGLTNPLYVTNARDGTNRLFIVEQAGRILVLQSGAAAPTVFLDIRSKVLSGGERGLLGLAVHPHMTDNRRFFVNYTRRPDGATVIAEYRVSAANRDVAETSESVLLTLLQPFANHNGGMIEFGPDGFLYIGMGDGGSGNDPGNRAQDTQELLGKILRIDVDHPEGPSAPYSSPSTNPFFGADPGRDEIFALGFRNPWRFSFDRGTGQLFVGDVGQGAREEVDMVTLGGNYGWRVFEGNRCTDLGPAPCNASSFTPPIAEYDHTGGRCSVTGGYVYRGNRSSLPAGGYVYADFCSGEIFLLRDGVQSLLLDTALSISSFGEDESGEIYVVGLGGTVHRIVNPNAPPNAPPDAAVALSAEALRTGQTITYQATVTPGSPPTLGDIYLGALLPDGVTFLSLVQGPTGAISMVLGLSPIPFLAGIAFSQPMVIPFSYTFLGSEPGGTYIAFAGMAVAGSDPLQSINQLSLGIKAFQFTP